MYACVGLFYVIAVVGSRAQTHPTDCGRRAVPIRGSEASLKCLSLILMRTCGACPKKQLMSVNVYQTRLLANLEEALVKRSIGAALRLGIVAAAPVIFVIIYHFCYGAIHRRRYHFCYTAILSCPHPGCSAVDMTTAQPRMFL
jgi:hypothetical protein